MKNAMKSIGNPRGPQRGVLLMAMLVVTTVTIGARPAMAGDGDSRRIDFVRPFPVAQKQAQAENRLLFVKPIYGGVDQLGAADYRCGRW